MIAPSLPREHLMQRVNHSISSDPDFVARNAFGQEVIPGVGGRGEMRIGEDGSEMTVDFLGVRVELPPGSQPCFYVGYRNPVVESRQGPGKSS